MKSTIALLLVVSACNNSADSPTQIPEAVPKKVTGVSNGNETVHPKDWLTDGKPLPGGYDTLRVAGGIAKLFPATQQAFDSLPTLGLTARPDSTNSPEFAAQTRVVRRDSRLIFTLDDGRQLIVRDDTLDTPEATAHYYWHQLASAHQWVVQVGLWEGSAILLVDQRTGRQTPAWGPASASPDGKYLMTYSHDMEAGYDPNGLQLYRVTTTGPRKLWEHNLTNWGPTGLKWLTNRSVLIRQYEGLPAAENATVRTSWSRLELPVGQ